MKRSGVAEAEAAAVFGPPTMSDRLRTTTEPASELQHYPAPTRCTLVTAFFWQRCYEIFDGLVELLLQVIHRITQRADTKAVRELAMASEP